mgnify:FL=1
MKKIAISLIIIMVTIVGGVIAWNLWDSNNNKQAQTNTSNYQAQRSSTNTPSNRTNTNIESTVPKKETEIATFSTKIHNKDSKRQNNISITCNNLSSTEIKSGETFSFCDIVGKATVEKGYQEADIFVNGEKKQGLGGGNCQVSTTLYNAVLQVPELEVLERHQHSAHVPYIKDGQDAAVSYGAYDFKFKNNTANTIKIVMENTANDITAKILKIE